MCIAVLDHWCLVWLHCLGQRPRVWWESLLLGLHNRHVVRQGLLGTNLACWVPGQHNLHLDPQDSLSEQHVSASHVHIVIHRVSRVDHQTVNKLHSLSSLPPELATDYHLAALGPALHDEPEHTIASPPRLGSLPPELATDHHLAALGPA